MGPPWGKEALVSLGATGGIVTAVCSTVLTQYQAGIVLYQRERVFFVVFPWLCQTREFIAFESLLQRSQLWL